MNCPNCGRACSERATWCIGCRYDFTTGQLRGAASPAAEAWQSVIPVGDRAGEHLHMERGQYGAWLYVVVGFCFNCFLWGLLFLFPLTALRHGAEVTDATMWGVSALGAIPSFITFHDRWRCTEAHVSRYLSGVMNISMLYAPLLVVGYANLRGLKKLRGG